MVTTSLPQAQPAGIAIRRVCQLVSSFVCSLTSGDCPEVSVSKLSSK